MGKVLQFPIKNGKSRPVSPDARINKLKARMAEVEVESRIIQDDIEWLSSKLEENKEEFRQIIHELAKLELTYEDS